MKTQQELRRMLREIDHKGYKAYKVLEGEYDFGVYRLCIDHVQGDPFATPSRVRMVYSNRGNLPAECLDTRERRIATEDYLLRRFHRALKGTRPQEGAGYARRDGREPGGRLEAQERGGAWERREHGRGSDRVAHGSGKSGLVTACRPGQEILERTSMRLTAMAIEARIEVGFPAFGRSIAAGELEKILFEQLPQVTQGAFRFGPQMSREIKSVLELADDQAAVRARLDELGLVAFVCDGAVLPRESGVSQKPLREAVRFESPESMAVVIETPHRGKLRGMGIRKGVTVICGGGFHGKSTLLKALERGVYNHIAGDGREFVLTNRSAFKLRAEEGRCIHETDISPFIQNLPTRADTTRFSTENASGSTSQAANTVEALAIGSEVLLIDEDTSATNFMIRDGRMAALVSDAKEPITPFIRKIRGLYDKLGVSTVLVVGSSGDYLAVADTVLQMDCYVARDVSERAKAIAGDVAVEQETVQRAAWVKKQVRRREIEKARTHGWDTISLDKQELDLRYLEQITDESQTAALAYVLQYAFSKLADGRKTAMQLTREVCEKIEREGILSVTPRNYPAGAASAVRREEVLAAMVRVRGL